MPTTFAPDARRARGHRAAAVLRPVLAALLVLAATLRAGAAADDHDLWYIIEMDGRRAGWMHLTQRTADGTVTTTSDTRITLKRGSMPMHIRVESRFVETAEGRPLSMRCVQSLGTGPTTTECTFAPDRITCAATDDRGQRTEFEVPAPEGAWLPPAAAAEFVRKRLEAGATRIELRTMDPALGPRAITSTTEVLERTTVEALGRTLPAIRTRETSSALPGISTVGYIDERGLPIRTSLDLGGIPMTVIAADRDLATAEADPPEIMRRTLVKPEGQIARPRGATRGVYVVSVPDGQLPDLPETGSQRVEPLDERTARVTVARSGTAAGAAPAPDEATEKVLLAPSAMLDATDGRIKNLAARATAGVAEATARAEAMRRFVHGYITSKDLSVGFASASQVAQTREGDCSEHACLLAAMLRADGIPARVVSGVVYVGAFLGEEGVFGYHMWTQALLTVDGSRRWVDLDATLPDGAPFDATHIALAVSTLADGEATNPLVTLVPLLGRARIKVETVEYE
jgi:transglutaminase-like putative cysteine protease